MRWLVRLTTPPGGLVFDPFTGSGSTGCAALLEHARFLGSERETTYIPTARARIAHYARISGKANQPKRMRTIHATESRQPGACNGCARDRSRHPGTTTRARGNRERVTPADPAPGAVETALAKPRPRGTALTTLVADAALGDATLAANLVAVLSLHTSNPAVLGL